MRGWNGAVEAVRNSLGTLQLLIGDSLLPGLSKLARQFAGWAGEAENQKKIQEDANEVIRTTKQVVDGVVPVMKAAAKMAKTFADAVGGWKDAATIVLSGLLATKLMGVATAVTAVGGSVSAGNGAAAAASKVGLLIARLKNLAGIAGISVAVDVLVNLKDKSTGRAIGESAVAGALLGARFGPIGAALGAGAGAFVGLAAKNAESPNADNPRAKLLAPGDLARNYTWDGSKWVPGRKVAPGEAAFGDAVGTLIGGSTTRLTKKQLEQLWITAGGNPDIASTMAAIALAESSGRVNALNDTPSTGDYSVGPWQVNYFGKLRAGRTRAYGSSDLLLSNPLANARAAVAIASSQGLNAWSTYKSDAYLRYLGGRQPAATSDQPLDEEHRTPGAIDVPNTSHTKIPLIPNELQIALTEAEIKKSTKGQLDALAAIHEYLRKRIDATKDTAKKLKLLKALEQTVRQEDGLEKRAERANPLIPKTMDAALKVARGTSGDYDDDITVLRRIVNYLAERIDKTKSVSEKLRLHNKLLDELASLEVASKKKQDAVTAAAQKAELAAIKSANAQEQAVIKGLVSVTNPADKTGGVVDLGKVNEAKTALAIAQAKLDAAKKKYSANSTQVASANLAVQRAQDALTKAQTPTPPTAAQKKQQSLLQGTQQVVFDPKSGGWIVATVKPNVDAMKAELDKLLKKTLPGIDKEIAAVTKAISRLSKRPKANQKNLAYLKQKLAELKQERTEIVGTANDLVTSINDIAAAATAAGETVDGTSADTSSSNVVVDAGDTQPTAVDNAAHREALAQAGEQGLEAKQKLAGTYDTTAAAQARADYINQSVIPAMQGVIGALQGQLAQAQRDGNQMLANQTAEAIAAKQNDILNEQLAALNQIKQNTDLMTQQLESNIQGYLGGIANLARGYSSNVLAAAFGNGAGIPNIPGRNGGVTINMQNVFQGAQTDPHLFSQSVLFELQALVA